MESTHLLKTTIYIALVFVLSGIFHELGHCIMCLILRCKIVELKIWFVVFRIDKGKVTARISFRGEEHCTFRSNSKIKMMIIIVSGPIINGIIALLFGIYILQNGINIVCVFGIVYNLLLLIYELYPESHGDGYMIKKTIDDIKKDAR